MRLPPLLATALDLWTGRFPMPGLSMGTESATDEKGDTQRKRTLTTDVAPDAAERGNMATGQHGHALVEFDLAVESRLRLKKSSPLEWP